ncbi:MAG: protein phosphatase CheZ [Pseudomonadota bacterium]
MTADPAPRPFAGSAPPHVARIRGAGADVAAPLGREEIAEIVHGVVSSLNGDLNAADFNLYQELEGLARFIQNAKSEITALRPDEIREKHVPTATDELGAIVDATAEATGVILNSAEQIEAASSAMPTELGQQVASLVTRIYEACNFQDVCGQRVTKVVKTLAAIDNKITELVAAFGDGVARPQVKVAREGAAQVAREGVAPAAKPTDAELVHGPQLPANAASQADIDALFDRL